MMSAMHLDAINLKAFYASPLGQVARRLLGARLKSRLGDLKGARVFGLGYATPYLGAIRSEADVLGALMPAGQGVIQWPEGHANETVLVEETELPLRDDSADCILLVHMLEGSENARELLRELWRVLSPQGRLLIVVPNRRGLWAQLDTTPFGHGSPYSRSQLATLLKDAMFSPENWQYALYLLPFGWRVPLRWPVFFERLGLVLWPAFSGVIVVEATKQVYGAVPVHARARIRRQFVPVPAGP
jgi:SAM-dependent methyltransferase